MSENKHEAHSKLKELIRQAFADVNAPTVEEIAYPNDWDYEDIVADLGKYRSAHVPGHILDKHATSLAALTPQGFAFFLPTYLLHSIEYIDSEVTDILMSQFHSATIKRSPSTAVYWNSRLALLTHPHCKAICDYIKHVVPRECFGLSHTEIEQTIEFWCTRKS